MKTRPISLKAIADFLQNEFVTERYPSSEQAGLYRASRRPVQRLGLALEPFPGLTAWVAAEQLDALWLHRPWQLDLAGLPPDVGILAYHLPFDETLTIGYNTALAGELGAASPPEPLGFKQSTSESGQPLPRRPIGMLFDVERRAADAWKQTMSSAFGGYDQAHFGQQIMVNRVAVVGAMNDTLVREAAHRGADLYLTGQFRPSAQVAVTETGIAVIAVGHRRSEQWGLQMLSRLLNERWPELSITLRS